MSTKVVFNKQNFFNNTNPNGYSCAGDAKNYFDPFSERAVPIKPDWVKNIAVELTNSNASGGASKASGCSLSGIGSSSSASCAVFDDLQPNNGIQTKAVLFGGQTCTNGTFNCSGIESAQDVWGLSLSNTNTLAAQTAPSSAVFWTGSQLTSPTSSSSNAAGVVWGSGDFDLLQGKFYYFGGSIPSTSSASGVRSFSNQIAKFGFNSDGSFDTYNGTQLLTTSSRRIYGNWIFTTTQTDLDNYFSPPPMTGNTFSFGIRRDPTLKSVCNLNENLGTETCTSSKYTPTLSPMISVNEDTGYFLLSGGIPASTAGTAYTSGIFSRHLYLYKPNSFSNDIGTSTGITTPSNGDWNLVSNLPSSATTLSETIMSYKWITYNGGTTQPFNITDIDPNGSNATSGWVGAAYHRTVYDHQMNRFYIFGGLENSGARSGAAVSAFTTTPSLATNEVWVYDPPALGRKPTAICYSSEMPDGSDLTVSGSTTVTSVKSAKTRLFANRSYLNQSYVFPPGGCLQRLTVTSSAPSARFEHSMAFDSNQRMMMVFGGCTTPATISADASTSAGSPLSNCSSASSLLNDQWIYFPPTTQEATADTAYRSASSGPFNSTSLIANIFNIDSWLQFFALFTGGNDVNSGSYISQPTANDVLGFWVQVSPSTGPSKRASASLFYDRSHHKFYLFGGYGCPTDSTGTSNCSQGIGHLNDLWEYTPPNLLTECSRENGTCSSSGSWKLIKSHSSEIGTSQPTFRAGSTMAFTESLNTYGDEFYTIKDDACLNQGPISASDSSVSKQYVGAIYIDIDRDKISSTENLLLAELPDDAYNWAFSTSEPDLNLLFDSTTEEL